MNCDGIIDRLTYQSNNALYWAIVEGTRTTSDLIILCVACHSMFHRESGESMLNLFRDMKRKFIIHFADNSEILRNG